MSEGELNYLIGKFEMFEKKIEDKIDIINQTMLDNTEKIDKVSNRITNIENKLSTWATVVKTVKFVGVFLFFLLTLKFEAVIKLLSRGL